MERLHEFGGARIVGERRMLLEDRRRQRILGLRCLHHRTRRRIHVEVIRWRVVDLLRGIEQLVAFEPDCADPNEVRLGILQARCDRPEITVAEFPLEK